MHRTDEAVARAHLLRGCYDAAIAAVQPAVAMRQPLGSLPIPTLPPAILAIGKASIGMADALVGWLAVHEMRPAAMLTVTHVAPPVAGVSPIIVGDHPTPGFRSAAAAGAVERWVRALPPDVAVHVAISGGASSLAGAPVPGLDAMDLRHTLEKLLVSGAPIDMVNAVRKRLLRLAGGRLGLMLTGHQVFVWIISDVPGDRISTIGSGPLSGDPWSNDALAEALRSAGLWDTIASSVRAALCVETVKPGDARLANIRPTVVATGAVAMTAGLMHAHSNGTAAEIGGVLSGDAAQMGGEIAHRMAAAPVGTVLAWCGETTVTLGAAHGTGGRSQEVALAAARVISQSSFVGSVLAASTDGQDGPTDVAGAIVDEATTQRIAAAGVSVEDALKLHNVTPALERAGALFRTGPSGTNVADLVFTVRG
jgi:glycerate 2-kinase